VDVSFTTPKTWSFGEVLTSTDMNTYVRDNTVALRAMGIGSNIVQTVKTDTFTTTSSTFVDVTGASVTITPSTATSKVLVIAYFVLGISSTGGDAAHAIITGGGGANTFVGDAAGDRVRAAASTGSRIGEYRIEQGAFGNTVVYLDSPGSATAQTYKLQVRVSTGTAEVGRRGNDTDSATSGRFPTSITAIEVAV
jgi:hypothetical protein